MGLPAIWTVPDNSLEASADAPALAAWVQPVAIYTASSITDSKSARTVHLIVTASLFAVMRRITDSVLSTGYWRVPPNKVILSLYAIVTLREAKKLLDLGGKRRRVPIGLNQGEAKMRWRKRYSLIVW